tara:strand:+ start:1613 stop:1948 length:336 start_codon:yes stop_codon:yes gene_type:complete
MSSVVDHIAIMVDDLELAEKWYIENVGGEVTHKQENYVRLKLQNTNLALLSKDFITSKPHVGILCDKMEDLPSTGAKVSHRDGTTGVYIKDPFGNSIEFIHYGIQCEKFLK